MEDSFRVRVDKVFGSLLTPAPSPSPSLWSLTDEEIEKKEWNRDKGIPDQDEIEDQEDCGPYAARFLGKKNKGYRLSLIEDLDDLEDEDEDGDEAGPSHIMDAKPDDHDEDEWMIRSSIGMDCTLDGEEEEDEFDKVAVGRDKAGDRTYMNSIGGSYVTYADTFHELPTSIEKVERDPRANRLAAKLRVMEDDETIGEMKSLGTSSDDRQIVGASTKTPSIQGEEFHVKSILKKDDKISDQKSLKRVRFDPESSCNSEEAANRKVKFAAAPEKEGQVSFPPPQTDPRVPDYLRNPSSYTHYTFDPADDLADEETNRKAYMEFFNLMRKKQAEESEACEDMGDATKPVIFVPRKRTTDDPRDGGSRKENIFETKGVCPALAAADEVCAMEEDEPVTFYEPPRNPRKAQRQYRAKATLELVEE